MSEPMYYEKPVLLDRAKHRKVEIRPEIHALIGPADVRLRDCVEARQVGERIEPLVNGVVNQCSDEPSIGTGPVSPMGGL